MTTKSATIDFTDNDTAVNILSLIIYRRLRIYQDITSSEISIEWEIFILRCTVIRLITTEATSCTESTSITLVTQ